MGAAENGHQFLIGDVIQVLASSPVCNTCGPVHPGFGFDFLKGLDHGALRRAVAFGSQRDLAAQHRLQSRTPGDPRRRPSAKPYLEGIGITSSLMRMISPFNLLLFPHSNVTNELTVCVYEYDSNRVRFAIVGNYKQTH